MGPVKYLLFYLAGGFAAMALQTVVDLDAAVPTLGASGAVSAVLGAYIVLHPRARVITLIFIILFFTIVELPAMVVLGLWFAEQLLFAALDFGTAGEGGGVAYFAHIGGFAFGLLTVKLLATRRRETRPAPYRT
jgi:membrane associated rhomboid family serine protease